MIRFAHLGIFSFSPFELDAHLALQSPAVPLPSPQTASLGCEESSPWWAARLHASGLGFCVFWYQGLSFFCGNGVNLSGDGFKVGAISAIFAPCYPC